MSAAAAAAMASMSTSSKKASKSKATSGGGDKSEKGGKSDQAGKKNEKERQKPKGPGALSEREMHAMREPGSSHGELSMFNSLFQVGTDYMLPVHCPLNTVLVTMIEFLCMPNPRVKDPNSPAAALLC
jgi:hypothetical protein